jgi:hypothetical protein
MINVLWKSYDPKRPPRLFGDQVMLDEIFVTNSHEFNYKEDNDGAIVCFSAVNNEQHIDKLNTDLAKLKWVLLIMTANENGNQIYKKIKHPNMKLWLQTPSPDDIADRFIGLGYPTVINKAATEEQYDWFFSGQVTHKRREECVEVLKKLPYGKLNCTEGFNQGYDYPEYISHMAKAKFIPCPAGAVTPDTFRVYEALEVGSIPILDDDGTGYWDKIFGKDHPLPVMRNWSNLEKSMDHLLNVWELAYLPIRDWWSGYKKEVHDNLIADVKELRSTV